MKNVSGCASVNVLLYVFSSELVPLNSIAARPLTVPAWNTGAWLESKAVRLRPKPLLSVQLVTAWPSVYASVFASYQSWSPAVTGGLGAGPPAAPITRVCADWAAAVPTPLDAVTVTRIVEPASSDVRA